MYFPFVSTQHFLDLIILNPEVKSILMNRIIQEKYHISKRINTSFNELDEITPLERKALLKLILQDLEEQKRILEAAKRKD